MQETKLQAWLEYRDPVTGNQKQAPIDGTTIRIGSEAVPAFIRQEDATGTPRFIIENRHLGHHLYLNDRVVKVSELTNLDEIRVGRAHYVFHMAYRKEPIVLGYSGASNQTVTEHASEDVIDPNLWPMHKLLAVNSAIVATTIGFAATFLVNNNRLIGIALFAMIAALQTIASILVINSATVSNISLRFCSISATVFVVSSMVISALCQWNITRFGLALAIFGLGLGAHNLFLAKKFELADWRKSALHWIISFGLGTIWIISVK